MVLLPLLASNDCLFNTLILGVGGEGVFCVCVLWGLYEEITKTMHIKYQFYNVNQILAHRKNKKQNKQKISHPKPTPLCSCLGEGKRISMKVGLKNSGGESIGDCSCTL